MSWAPVEDMANHRAQGCNLEVYLCTSDGEHWYDADCQIKFVPPEVLQ